MTDLRPTMQDAFERELRAALLASTASHAPRSLGLAAAAIVARPRRVQQRPWGRVAAAALAAAFGLAVIGFGLGPVASILQPAIAPATSPTAALPSVPATPAASGATPSVAPSAVPTASPVPAYDLRTDWVHLIADELVVELDGKRSPVEIVGEPSPVDGSRFGGGSVIPTSPSRWRVPYVLRAGGLVMLLDFHLRADATDWWVEDARLYPDGPKVVEFVLRGPDLRIPIGQALHGDITFTGDNDGAPVSVTMTNMALDPAGLGTGPHTWEGCTRFTDLDPAAKASLRDAKRPAKVAAIAKKLDLCVIYLWTSQSTEGGHLIEVWCTAPTSGAIYSIRAGESGEAVVDVNDPARKRTPRPQPVEGWGCEPSPQGSPTSPG